MCSGLSKNEEHPSRSITDITESIIVSIFFISIAFKNQKPMENPNVKVLCLG